MTASDPDDMKRKAKELFDRAEQVYQHGHLEYSIDFFLRGLQQEPEAVEAHKRLRHLSLERKAAGGKSLGMFEKMKLSKSSGSPAQYLANAAKLLAHDPANLEHMHALHQAATNGGFVQTAEWIDGIIQRASGTP